MSSERTVLRPPHTSLIGRQDDIARLLSLLDDPGIRLITLIGPGGVGKTRLALRVAELVDAAGQMQVEVVDLSSIEDPLGMLAQIARSFDIWQHARVTPLDRIATEIGTYPFLLVLDNLEQIASGSVELLALLDRCPKLRILATSRSPLNLSAEQRVPVSTLPVPKDGWELASVPGEGGSAVDLFVARARSADPGFELTGENAQDVATICRQLDGLPLAIELAAARSRELPPRLLVTHLEQALPILTGGPRDRPRRHRAMRDAISWSYRLLDDDEKRIFRALSVFRGFFSLASARVVVAAGLPARAQDQSRLLDAVNTLLNNNLLVLENDPRAGLGYRMLTIVREFGFEQLGFDAEEEARVRDAHARLIMDTIALEVPGAYGSTNVAWLRLVDAQRADLDAALVWSFDRGEALVGVGLTVSASAYWFDLGRAADSIKWLPIASRVADSHGDLVPPEQCASLLIETVLAATMSGQFALAFAVAESKELQAVVERCDPHTRIAALTARSMLADFRHEFDSSLALATEAEALGRQYPEALSVPWAVTRLGWELWTLGVLGRSRDLIAEAHAMFVDRGDPLNEAILAGTLAQIYLAEGDPERASALLIRCFALQLDLFDPWGAVSDIATAAELALEGGDPGLSAQLLGACAARDVQHRIAQQPVISRHVEQVIERTRTLLGTTEFEHLYEVGTHFSLTEALELGLGIAQRWAGSRPSESTASNGDLTAREREVLQLVTAGRTDRQIADTLFVSRRTVNTHVTHILGKLGVSSRAEAAAEAVRRDLV